MSPLLAGCAKADITPEPGVPLSGFISRENKPSEKVYDSIWVRVLALKEEGDTHFIANYDLLGISPILEEEIYSALESALGAGFSRQRCVLISTHTHSAPTTSAIEGEVEVGLDYRRLVCTRTVEVAQVARNLLAPVTLSTASLHIPGLTYNRRSLLADGSVSMDPQPGSPVMERGPMDDLLTVLVFQGEADCRAVIAHFPCHGVSLGALAISGDIPGELSRRFEARFGAPCLFLPGASGDLNPLAHISNYQNMLEWCDRFISHTTHLSQQFVPIPCTPLHTRSTEVLLDYHPLPDRSVMEQNLRFYEDTAAGIPPDKAAQPGERMFTAWGAYAGAALARNERRRLEVLDSGKPLLPRPMHLSLWQMGGVIFVFAAAEVFAITGLALRAMADHTPEHPQIILPVTHLASPVGYIPDRASFAKGGYEVDDAWRYYKRSAPFAADSEERILSAVQNLIKQL